jgi:hypothetical protein
LAISVLIWMAAVTLDRRVVRAALITTLIQAVSHFSYHLIRLGALAVGDDIANQLSLAYSVVLSAVLLLLTHAAQRRRRGTPAANQVPGAATRTDAASDS